MSTTKTTELKQIVAALWVEYNKDDELDGVRMNRLVEKAGRVLLQEMSMEELDKLGESYVEI